MNKESFKLNLKFYVKANLFKKEINYVSNKKRVYLLLTPLHGNLGDHAITYSEIKFLKDRYPSHEICEITLNDFPNEFYSLKKSIKNEDIIFITGGGNLGDLYFLDEFYRRKVVETFKNNEINSFPQSLAFKENSKEIRNSNKIYSNHINLNLVFREKKSLELGKKYFNGCNISFCPDIVLYNKVNDAGLQRENVMFLLRNDAEKTENDETVSSLKKIMDELFYHVEPSDTHLGEGELLDKSNRFIYLEKKMEEISSYKLVVTDRLHGMILSYITGTPCIVLNNSTGKVLSTYNDWLKNAESVKAITEENNDLEQMKRIILELYENKASDEQINLKFEGIYR